MAFLFHLTERKLTNETNVLENINKILKMFKHAICTIIHYTNSTQFYKWAFFIPIPYDTLSQSRTSYFMHGFRRTRSYSVRNVRNFLKCVRNTKSMFHIFYLTFVRKYVKTCVSVKYVHILLASGGSILYCCCAYGKINMSLKLYWNWHRNYAERFEDGVNGGC